VEQGTTKTDNAFIALVRTIEAIQHIIILLICPIVLSFVTRNMML